MLNALIKTKFMSKKIKRNYPYHNFFLSISMIKLEEEKKFTVFNPEFIQLFEIRMKYEGEISP